MFVHLKTLYESELHSNVNQVAPILLSTYNQDRSTLTPDQYFLTLCYYAYSLYEERLYRKAEEIFKTVLLSRKAFMKVKGNLVSYDVNVDYFTEIEIRYKFAQCYQALKQPSEVLQTLQTIAVKNRPAKVNMLMFKLLQHSGYDKSTIGSLKTLLKECPMNLEAIRGLLALGVKPPEIHSLIGDTLTSDVKEFLSYFIEAFSNMHMSKFAAAIEAFKQIEANNENILTLIGQCYHYLGNSEVAANYLTRAYQLNNHLSDGLMTLAAVYANLNRLEDLEKLIPPNTVFTDVTPEYWFILAQHLYCQGKYEKAAYFAQQSCHMKPRNIEASLLKVKIFIHFKRYKDALVHLRVLEEFACYRFEVYELLVEAYLATNRYREAQEVSRRVFRRQGTHIVARSFVLLAKTYLSQPDPVLKIKAKSLLERALEKDPYCLSATFLMVDILLESGDTSGAVKLIMKQCTTKPNSKLYAILGDILSKEKNHMKAVENYTIALNMDPSNRRAMSGLTAMGPLGQSKDSELTRTVDFEEMLDVPANTTGEAESESDALWSDIDLN